MPASRSSSEDGGEAGLDVSHVGGHGGGRSSLHVVRRLELGLVLFAFHWHSPLDRLLRVRLVNREAGNGPVVTNFRRVCRLEWLIVRHGRRSHWLGGTLGKRRVFLKDLAARVKGVPFLDSLRERLLLHPRLADGALFCSDKFRPGVVILNVGDFSTKGHLLSDLAFLHWVRSHIGRTNQYLTWVFVAHEVFLDFNVVSHVRIGKSRLCSVFKVRLGLERFLVAHLDLPLAILFATKTLNRRLVWVTERIIAGLAEENSVDGSTFLNGFGSDVGRVNDDLSRVVSFAKNAS